MESVVINVVIIILTEKTVGLIMVHGAMSSLNVIHLVSSCQWIPFYDGSIPSKIHLETAVLWEVLWKTEVCTLFAFILYYILAK